MPCALRGEEARWRQVLLLAMEAPEADLPPIPRGLLPDFASYWNRIRASLKGDAAQYLAIPLRRKGLEHALIACWAAAPCVGA
jgi:hypothetical protein